MDDVGDAAQFIKDPIGFRDSLCSCQIGEAGDGGSRVVVGVAEVHALFGDVDLGPQPVMAPPPKADVAARRLATINPDIEITAIAHRMDDAELRAQVDAADVVLDGCDNFATRFQVNDACVAAGTRLISGAAIRLEGQVAEFGPDYSASPCYRCLYKEADESLENCAGNGVLSPVPGAIGALMAVEALKFLAGIESRRGVLRLFDAISGEFRAVGVRKRPDCPACG